jgi:hypothetical protein
METITDRSTLKKRIAFLEQRREDEKHSISNEFAALKESLRPANLIRKLFHSVKESPDIKTDIMHGLLGLGTGFLTNKFLLGKLHGPFKKILATVLQAGITNAAVKYPEAIKEKGLSLLAKFFKAIRIKDVGQEHQSAATVL